VEEQQAVAAEGGDSLKQAAKRVRDAKKKPKAEKPVAEEGADAAPLVSAEALQARVTELEAENERLRMQVKTLQELLAEQG
ncbi:MAG: plasmid replication/partition related protein, partial [Comamonas sp.]|nr:plasmid replication/partition related protein [Candidatus Comamonas equi]